MKYNHKEPDIFDAVGLPKEDLKEVMTSVAKTVYDNIDKKGSHYKSSAVEELEKLAKKDTRVYRYVLTEFVKSIKEVSRVINFQGKQEEYRSEI